jgi:hypothetical protein
VEKKEPMIDPAKEWHRLYVLYEEMGDPELQEMAEAFAGLTEIAQDVLREEMRRRGLGEPQSHAASVAIRKNAAPAIESGKENLSWVLREAADSRALAEMQASLEAAGIRSDIVLPQDNYYRTSYPQLQVAENDAERAEEILTHPQLRAIFPEQEDEIEDFQLPQCKSCGAYDLLLESVEPFNVWLCEECGEKWSEKQ